MSDHDMELFMTYLSEAHRHGFTHRRITPETLSRMENGQPVIAGWQNGDYGSAPPNYALDKVQLLVLLGALNGIDRAIACARRTWGDEQLIDLAPFIQKAAVPAAIRALPACDKHMLNTLRSRIAALAPQEVADSMETGYAVAVQFPFLHRDRAAGRRRVCGVHPDSTGRNDQGGQRGQHRHGSGMRAVRTAGLVRIGHDPWLFHGCR